MNTRSPARIFLHGLGGRDDFAGARFTPFAGHNLRLLACGVYVRTPAARPGPVAPHLRAGFCCAAAHFSDRIIRASATIAPWPDG